VAGDRVVMAVVGARHMAKRVGEGSPRLDLAGLFYYVRCNGHGLFLNAGRGGTSHQLSMVQGGCCRLAAKCAGWAGSALHAPVPRSGLGGGRGECGKRQSGDV
jgi:hypothetical protein